MLHLADRVFEKLRSQNASRTESTERAVGTEFNTKTAIKITTIKSLAQFLDDADVLAPHASIPILKNLFEASTHIDVRDMVLKSLLAKLVASKDDRPTAEAIFMALELLIPVAGSLNERCPTTESDWAKVEGTGLLPEIHAEGGPSIRAPPLLHLIQFYCNDKCSLSLDDRRTLMKRVTLPITEQSIANNTRWIELLVAKYRPDSTTVEMPVLPLEPRSLGPLLESSSDMLSTALLDLYHRRRLTNMSPSAEVATLNAVIYRDPVLRESSEGEYWLSMYGKGADVYSSLPNMLKRDWQPTSEANAISVDQVQDLVFEQAMTLLITAQQPSLHFDSFMQRLAPDTSHYLSHETRKSRFSHVRPVLERLIQEIDTRRTPEWQRDPNRQPPILPETFKYRLWLLDYPILHPHSPQTETHKRFATQLISKLGEVFHLGIAHHAKLTDIESAASSTREDQDYEPLIRHLGHLPTTSNLDHTSPTLQKLLLRIDLARALFHRWLCSGTRVHVSAETREMVRSWRGSEVEEIRMKGVAIGDMLANLNGEPGLVTA